MKKLLYSCTVIAALAAFPAMAQDATAVEIPSLADVMSDMDTSEIAEMESSIGDVGSLSGDFDVAIDVAVDSAVAEAIEEGLISAEEATDAAASLSIVADNAQFFNFDIMDAIADVISSGEFTMAQVRSTLEGFNSLSDAGKAVVGQESFDYMAAHDSTDPNYSNALTEWNKLSASDKAIVENQMPLLSEEAPGS